MSDPSAQEILLWAMVNQARLDPNGEAAHYGISLNEGPVQDFNKNVVTLTGTSKQPLAFNSSLYASADAHAQDMINRNIQFHTDPNNPNNTPDSRAAAAGYVASPFQSIGENIANIQAGGALDPTKAATDMFQNLFVDSTQLGRGHRYNILLDNYQEIGVGQAFGTMNGNNASEVSMDFGVSASTAQFLTGIAYNDTDHNAFYSIGEGRGGITVATTAGNVVTQTAGNYSHAINAGTQTITFSGGDLAAPVSVIATVLAGRNAMIDMVDQNTVETSVSLTAGSGVTKIIGLGNTGLTLTGNGANNVLLANIGTNTLDGAAGTDTAVFAGTKASYTITNLADGSMTVAGSGVSDHLISIEKIQFADQLLDLTPAPPPPPPPPPAGSVVIGDASVQEGDTGTTVMTFTVTRSGGTAAFDVDFATHAGTASASDNDYVGRSNTLHFDTNQTVQTISVTVNGDTKVEGNENFTLVLSNATNGATISHDTGIGTIIDDDHAAPVRQVTDDFNGDGKSDILWHSNSGNVATWDMNDHTYTGFGFGAVPTNWQIAGTGDFNGDHKTDVLWRDASGNVATWDMNDHTYTGFSFGAVPTSWHIAGTGDFDGDGKTDILWRNDSGAVSTWDMNDHTFTGNNFGVVPNNWHVAGTGDFNGDGKSDILWQSDTGAVSTWDMNDKTFTGFNFGNVAANWHVAGTGDFNGDGKTDILWRSDSGDVATWDMNDHTYTGFNFGNVPTDWKIVGTGDYNGDHKTDILWQNSSGAVATWDMNDHTYTGFGFGNVPTDWHIV